MQLTYIKLYPFVARLRELGAAAVILTFFAGLQIIQAADGTLHASYSYFVPPASVVPDAQKQLPRKTIKHAHFSEAWIKEGDR